jgi:uncharacterized protein
LATLLYADSSSLLTLALEQAGWEGVRDRLAAAQVHGTRIVSSRLLALEAQRVIVREGLAGRDLADRMTLVLGRVDLLPVTEDVWRRASSIEQHIKSLDALHLATCELVEAALFVPLLDSQILRVAMARGVPIA